MFFFNQTISTIHRNFPDLFEGEVEDDEDSREGETKSPGTSRQSRLQQFGIIPYIDRVCREFNENWDSIMNKSVSLLFYLTTYCLVKDKEQEKMLKQIRNKK